MTAVPSSRRSKWRTEPLTVPRHTARLLFRSNSLLQFIGQHHHGFFLDLWPAHDPVSQTNKFREANQVRRCTGQYLEALIEERHVSNAANRLGINQPAMSLALKKLREILHDPIFVKTDNGYIATETAMAVLDELRDARNIINKALENRSIFSPNDAELEFTIAASESVAIHLVPKVIERASSINKKIRIRCMPLALPTIKGHLEEGRVDLMLSYTSNAPPALRHSILQKEAIVGVKSANNRAIASRVTLDEYLAQDHVYHELSKGQGSSIELEVDRYMTLNGLSRRKVCSVHSTPAVASTVGISHMVAALPRSIAELLAQSMKLEIFELPIELDSVSIGMYWHERSHNLGSHRWLRQLVKEVCDN